MEKSIQLSRCLLAAFFALVFALVMAGCEGSDGSDGAQGEPGERGPQGVSDPVTGKASEPHTLSGRVVWTLDEEAPIERAGNDVVIKVNIKVDDENRHDLIDFAGAARYFPNENGSHWIYESAEEDVLGTFSIEYAGDGDYIITLSGWNPGADPTSYMVRLNNGVSSYPEANITAHLTDDGAHVRNIVSNQSCINCHGDNIFTGARGEYTSTRVYHNSSFGVESCTTCHQREGRDNLPRYVHGIHNANNLNGDYGSEITIKNNWNYSVRYPGDMANCAACHDNEESLNYVLAQPVSWENCLSCHGGSYETDPSQAWRGFTDALDEEIHQPLTAEANCTLCHDDRLAPATVGDYHRGYSDSGLAQKIAREFFQVEITRVDLIDGENGAYGISWTAVNPSENNAAYNICGITAVDGLGNVAFEPNVRLGYFEPAGDDITNKGRPFSNGVTGQPGNAIGVGTTCEGGVATTTVTLHDDIDPGITRALAILKPQASVTANKPGQFSGLVRIAALSDAFNIEDGAYSPRRLIVDSAKCLDCHQSVLYNHSPTSGRFDNVDSCIVCHNPSATDIGVRQLAFINPIHAGNSYDGKDAETFSLAYNMHAIHGAGASNAFYVVYRGRGIYGYGGTETAPHHPWPYDEDDNPKTYVSADDAPLPAPHYLKQVDYPRPLADCTACHFEGTYGVPDQREAVPVSIDFPAGQVTPGGFQNQNLATQLGPAAGACMSCHASDDDYDQLLLRYHAYQNGWTPQAFAYGKKPSLDLQEIETCKVCHKK